VGRVMAIWFGGSRLDTGGEVVTLVVLLKESESTSKGSNHWTCHCYRCDAWLSELYGDG
jgi:hypothetical protein